MAVKEEEVVDVGMWRKVVVGASERRLMEAMAGVGVERPCAAGRQREEERRGLRRREEEDEDEWLP
jgi:hypothetical protein